MDCSGYTQNRIIASYLDGNHLICNDPEHLVINECFFLGSAAIGITATKGNHQINGLTITSNEWDGGSGPAIYIDETAANFTSVIDTYIEGNEYSSGYSVASSHTIARLMMNNSDTFCFDLTNSLIR